MNIATFLSRRHRDQRAEAEGAGANQHPGGDENHSDGAGATAEEARDDVRRASGWSGPSSWPTDVQFLADVVYGFIFGAIAAKALVGVLFWLAGW